MLPVFHLLTSYSRRWSSAGSVRKEDLGGKLGVGDSGGYALLSEPQIR